jgi:N6-L-threonylcarbamoyladenine synthase
MRVLGIETSCDETAASVVENGRLVRSSAVATQEELHAEYGGVVPEIAGRAHVERILPVIERALRDAGQTFETIDAVAVGHRPGLIGSLLVGVSAGKSIAWARGLPLVGVDHVQAHLYAPLLIDKAGDGTESNNPQHDEPGALVPAPREDPRDPYPALGLVVSGGHTAIYRCDAPHRLTRLGSTIDDAVGEVYDKVATILGLEYPGGPRVDALAAQADADDRAADFPISRLDRDSLDFSFSGLKTAVLYEVKGRPASTRPGKPQPPPPPALTDSRKRDIAASFQRAAVGGDHAEAGAGVRPRAELQDAAGGRGRVGEHAPAWGPAVVLRGARDRAPPRPDEVLHR